MPVISTAQPQPSSSHAGRAQAPWARSWLVAVSCPNAVKRRALGLAGEWRFQLIGGVVDLIELFRFNASPVFEESRIVREHVQNGGFFRHECALRFRREFACQPYFFRHRADGV